MTLGGTYDFPEFDTQPVGDAIDVPIIGRVRASAHVVGTPDRAEITNVDVRRGTASITGNAIADIAGDKWTGSFVADAPHAEELQADVPEAWRVTGPMRATATLGGTFDVYTLDTDITGSSLTWAGQTIDKATAKATVTPTEINVTSLALTQGAGYLDGRVRYEWETGAYDANLKGDRLSWQGAVLAPNDTQALFSMQFTGAGTTAQPKGNASVDFVLTGGQAGALIGSGQLTADLMGDQARVVARLPAIGALVNADIATASPYDYRATAVLDRLELARLSPLLGTIEAEVLGFASGNVTASGSLVDSRDRVAIVNLTQLDAGIGGVPVSLNAPGSVSLRGDDITLKGLDLKSAPAACTATGDWNTKLDGRFQGQFVGEFQDAIRMGRAVGVPVTFDGSGPLNIDLRSNGSRAGTLATLTLKAGTFTWGGGPPAVTNLNVDAVLQGESLTVSRITGDVASGGVVGSFSASAKADVPVLELAAINGELTVDAAKFTFSGIPVEQQRPSRIEFAAGALAMADVSWSVANNPLVMGGTVGFAAADPPLNLSVQGLVDLRVLSAFVSTLAFDGNANINTLIEGTVSKPLLDGRIVLDDAEVAVSYPRLVLSELDGPILLDGQRIVLDGVRGLANGGPRGFDGTLDVEGLDDRRRRGEHPGAGRGDRAGRGAAQRDRRAGHVPARSESPGADRRHPHRAELVHRNHHDRGPGAPVDAAGVADGAAAVSRSRALEPGGHDQRGHRGRQQLRPAGGRAPTCASSARWRRPVWTAESRCARAAKYSWPAGPSALPAATFRSRDLRHIHPEFNIVGRSADRRR